MRRFPLFLLLILCAPALGAEGPEPRPVPYWRLPGYLQKTAAEQAGGRVVEMPEFNSLYVLGIPKSELRPSLVLIDLSEKIPYEPFKSLYPAAAEKNSLLVSLLVWQGGELYLPPEKIYRMIEVILKTLKEQYGIDPKKSLLVPAASLDSLALPLKRLD